MQEPPPIKLSGAKSTMYTASKGDSTVGGYHASAEELEFAGKWFSICILTPFVHGVPNMYYI